MTFQTFSVTLAFSFLFLFEVTTTGAENFTEPPNFPKSIQLNLTDFRNWDDTILVKNVWTVEPKNASEIVQVTNWAFQNGYKVKATGLMHNWSPLTLLNESSSSSETSQPPKIILLKTAKNLNQMGITSNEPGRSTFWAEPGITMDKLLETLEKRNLELLNVPAIGNVTLGGVLATGGHGTGVRSTKEANDDKSPDGHCHGSLSNLIVSLTAVVYSKNLSAYTVQKFSRRDPQTSALLVNLGRIIITNVTMRAKSMTYLRCQSFVDIRPEELLAHPNPNYASGSSSKKIKNTLTNFLNTSGTLEVTMYPFTDRPWLKKWSTISREECESKKESTVVNEPYNYPFLDKYPQSVVSMAREIQNGSHQRAQTFGPLLMDLTVESLELSQSGDMCGPSKNTLLYLPSSSSVLKFGATGWAIVTKRINVQRVVYETHQYYKHLLYNFAAEGSFPINGPISYKITGMDEARDAGVGGSETETPVFSPTSKYGGGGGGGGDVFDTIVWFDISTFPQTPDGTIFMAQLEKYFSEIFDGDWALLKGDWSKGWGLNNNVQKDNEEGPWKFLSSMEKRVKPRWENYVKKMDKAVHTLNTLDPFDVVSNEFLTKMIKSKTNVTFCSLRKDGAYFNRAAGCGSYYRCVGHQTEVIECPPPLHFSFIAQRCDLPEDAGCKEIHYFPELEHFPLVHNDSLVLKKFKNWAGEIVSRFVWTAYPRSGADVVMAANWARMVGFKLRPSGFRHTWAPFTIANSDVTASTLINELEPDSPEVRTRGGWWNQSEVKPTEEIPVCSKTMLLKTRTFMNKMGIISNDYGDASFWAEPGVSMENLLTFLEFYGLGLLTHPAPGELTLGGVLAIGGHGAGVSASEEKLLKGHTFGSLSNLVMAFTAVVFDDTKDKYVLKDFRRSDKEAKAFLVSLGRTFITNITMRAGPLLHYRCMSLTHIPKHEVYAHPDKAGENSFAKYLDQGGRVETILFSFTETPWIKVWEVVDQEKMISLTDKLRHILPSISKNRTGDLGISRQVYYPYNFPFSDYVPELLTEPIKAVGKCSDKRCTRAVSEGFFRAVQAGLLGMAASDIWGAAKNVMLYIKPTTLKVTANGYAVITRRDDIQRAVHEVYKLYDSLMESYASKGMFPISIALELRMTAVESPEDVGIDGAEAPSLSALHPVEGHDDWDTALWVNVLTVPGSVYSNQFYAEFEGKAYKIFNGDWATIRIEWSKGWAYQNGQAYRNDEFKASTIPKGFPKGVWNFAVNTLNKYDPHRVFSNEFLNKLLVPR